MASLSLSRVASPCAVREHRGPVAGARPCCFAPISRGCRLDTRIANSLEDKIFNTISDLSKGDRVKVIDKLYKQPTRERLQSVLSDKFVMSEDGYSRQFTKADYLRQMCDVVLPAIPDFAWGHATNGEVDKDGYAIVTVQATGHHTGGPLVMPGLEPLQPSGKHFCLAEEVQKVKVEGDKITQIQVLPTKGAGPRALYAALGGKLPAAKSAAPPMP